MILELIFRGGFVGATKMHQLHLSNRKIFDRPQYQWKSRTTYTGFNLLKPFLRSD